MNELMIEGYFYFKVGQTTDLDQAITLFKAVAENSGINVDNIEYVRLDDAQGEEIASKQYN